MSRNLIMLSIVFGLHFWAAMSLAQTEFTYQGQLKEAGLPAGGDYDFRFRVFNAPSGGAQIGSPALIDDWPVADGLFTVPLDFGIGVFNGDPRWLQVEVRPGASGGAYTVLSPRQPLTAVPYALYAFGGPGGGGGFWTANGSHIYNTNAGRVGIGTTDPEAPLHVFGGSAGAVTAHANSSAVFERAGANYVSILSPTANERGLLFGDPSSFVNGGIIYNSGSVPNGFQFRTAVNTTRMVITEPGNVGVGTSTPTARLHAQSPNSGVVTAIRGQTASPSGTGVVGHATATTGFAIGVSGQSDSSEGAGVFGSTNVATGQCYGVWGLNFSSLGRAVYGQSLPTAGTHYGVYGSVAGGTGAGVFGVNTGSGSAAGVEGQNYGTAGIGVLGRGVGFGVAGFAESLTAIGVYGANILPGGVAIKGYHETITLDGDGVGVEGRSYSALGYGVYGSQAGSGNGVRGAVDSPFGYGVYSVGNLGASGTKSFVIDHPADPENKYLKHYCAEGPDPLNVYGGVARLDGAGRAIVELPDYFSEINRDPRIQLTAAGASMPNLYASEDVVENRFEIAGGRPGGKVYWEVKAVRNDLWVRTYGAPIEVLKPGHQRGKYQHPELYGQPAEMGIDYHKPTNPVILPEPGTAPDADSRMATPATGASSE